MIISIIIPVYKVEAYILDCLKSVASQSLSNGVECILVDDCGGDRSMEIAEQFISSYQGSVCFRIIKHDQNKGLSAARNSALRICNGQYVFFLDSDDYIFPNAIENMYNLANKYPNVDVVQGYYTRHKQGEEEFNEAVGYPEYSNNRSWIRNRLCDFRITDAACNRLVRKDFIIDNSIFFQEGFTQEDTIWTYDVQKYINSIAFCKEFTYYYRSTPNSIMNSLTREKKARDYSRVHNIAIAKMVISHIDPCEVEHIAHLSAIVTKQIGLNGIKLMNNRDNPFIRILYRCQHFRDNTSYFIVKGLLEIPLRVYYILLSNKKMFLYKLNK